MQYSGHATEQDCVSEIRDICKATSNTYSTNAITRRFNFALDRYFELAFEGDGRWKFDDANQTDVPLETLNLTSGTNKYDMSTLTSELFQLFKIELLDSNDKGVILTPESFESLRNQGLTFQDAYSTATSNQGIPNKYIKWGDFLYLSPTPNYTKTAAIKFYFNRKASYMAATDTTKVPGVPALHHKFLCRYAALPYVIKNLPAEVAALKLQIQEDEAAIRAHFSRRSQDEPQTLRPVQRWPKR